MLTRDAVTGAFGFTGRAIATQLLDAGHEVVTLSRRSGHGDPLEGRVTVASLDFARPDELSAALQGVATLYNTYWIRFPRRGGSYERTIEQSLVLFDAARRAGVSRLVHVSVVNASPVGPTEYIRAKGLLETLVQRCGIPATIVRPTLTFGADDILVNNMAWALRRLPVYGIPGDGRYRIQPVHVDDVARLCVEAGQGTDSIADAAGPDVMTYHDMVATVRAAIGSRALLVPMPKAVVLGAAVVLGLVVRDVVLTRDEIRELSSSVLVSRAPARGRIAFGAWVAAEADGLGRRWSSELSRNYAAPNASRR